METISGYENRVEEFLKQIKEVWETQGKKARGSERRYKIVIGRVNNRAVFVPTVSTRAGTENLIAWNLSQEDIEKIVKEAKAIGIPISARPYLWFAEVPASLPRESEQPEQPLDEGRGPK